MEIWDVYDKDRMKTNKTHVRGTPLAADDYHIVVSACIKNNIGQILLTKRHQDKPHPNLWECPGGSILAGESSLDGVLREVKEEIGVCLSRSNGKMIKSDRRDVYHDFHDIWLFHQSFEITETTLQKDEVIDIKWVAKSELESMYHSNLIVPTLSFLKLIF